MTGLNFMNSYPHIDYQNLKNRLRAIGHGADITEI